MRPSVLVVDIDGTMTDMSRRLDLEAVAAVRRVEASGVPVIPATGNAMPVTKAFQSFVGTTGPLVCENGGVVYSADLAQRNILFSRALADRAVEHLKREGMDVAPIWSDSFRDSEVALALGPDPDEIRSMLAGWGLRVVATRFAIHLVDPALNKRLGVDAALDLMGSGLTWADVAAIGDAGNDTEMLGAAAYSGSVGNATPEAKAAASDASDHSYGAGVVDLLTRWGLA